MNEAAINLAKILRTDKDHVYVAAGKLRDATGHNDVLTKIDEENKRQIKDRLERLGVNDLSAKEIYAALTEKMKNDDQKLFETLQRPTCDSERGCKTLLNIAKELANVGKGYFLKEDKAREFLLREPPQRILKFFKFKDVNELLNNYDLFEVYSALRFVEDKTWLNGVFFKQLENITSQDFEEREIQVKVLSGEWLQAAEFFLKKKYHNVSHLKELGVIFIMPLKIDAPGETMRLFSLVLHYLHEVDFYSNLFKVYNKKNSETFSQKLISALRGDVLDQRFPENDRGKKWMIVQQYLAKDDEFDWRLFEPHVNPEAIHWSKAENDIARLAVRFDHLGLEFWNDLDFVGDFFKDESGIEALISFNLIDTTMSVVMKKEMIKYLYHHQEALWNKIFSGYLGQERMEQLIIDNFDNGYITI